MTTQVQHSITYRKQGYALAATSGSGLFNPHDYGIHPVALDTANWRGYLCQYSVSNGELHLEHLNVGLSEHDKAMAERGEGPVLFGQLPKLRRVTISAYNVGNNMQLEELTLDRGYDYNFQKLTVPFSGGLLLANDFISKFMGYMPAYHPAYEFKEVHELVFEKGRLIKEANHSRTMAEFRKKFANYVNARLEPVEWEMFDLDNEQKRAEERRVMEETIKDWMNQRLTFDYGW
jgi:hypothetical protein